MAEAVGDLYYQVTLETQKLIAEARKVEERLQRMADKGGQAGDQLQGRMTAVAAAISAALSAIAVEALVTKIISAQRQFDVMFASLKTITGGLDQASVAYEKLTKFAAQTPFTLKQSVDGFVKLKALGLDPSERAMTSFGNTSSAMGKDLMQMIEAVADASTSEFERLKEFGIKAKQEGDKVSLTFQGVTTTIGNNAREITEYLIKIGETNFAGAMAERMDTLDGNISNLQDSLDGLFLSIAQSGFGEAVASGVRSASEAISELTASIKQGELTDYFAALKPVITAAEVAVVSLAGAVTGRLIVAFVASATQAYATATAMGAATVAARGFTAVLAALGGPIGIAITGLALLALNWEKVAGEARDAATMSEDAAGRIAKALGKGGAAAGKALSSQLAEVRGEISAIDKELSNKKFPLASPADLDELRKRKETLQKIATDITAAMDGTRAKPDATTPGTPTPTPVTPKPKKDKADQFDDEAYLSALRRAQATEIGVINETETEALRRSKKLLDEKKINEQTHAEAVKLITQTAEDDRVALMAKTQADIDKARLQTERETQSELDKIKNNREAAQGVIASVNPIEALRFEEQQKLAVLEEHRLIDLANTQLYEDAKLAVHQATAEKIRQVNDQNAAKEQALQSQQLQNYSNLFGGMAGLTKSFAGEQSGIYKAMFATQKAFSIASSIIAIQKGLAEAAGNPWPTNIAAMASVAAATSGIVSTISGTNFGGGRQYGGPVSSGSMYRVNETGAPEMFTGSNGQQYMLPTKSGSVTPADQVGGGQAPTIIIQNMGTPQQVSAQSYDKASNTMTMVMNDLAQQFRSNEGKVWDALRSSTNVRGVL